MRTKQKGFTIVELLIVIVVIGVLAAITVIAFGGIQNRTENTKTISAVTQWAKAIRMYETDTGSWPTVNSCLGDADTYADSYSGRCYTPETSGWVVNSSFLTQMQPYINSYPEPSSKNITNDSAVQYRGAMFYRASTTDIQIRVMLLGVASCPDITGLGASYSSGAYTYGRMCFYRLAGP